MTEPLREETQEKWQEGLLQRPASCACRFEWRPTPDFSGVPPKQLDECGFHAMQRTTLERDLAESERKLEQARQDAERYRWLRCCTVAKFRELSHANIVKGVRFDEQVDAARKP